MLIGILAGLDESDEPAVQEVMYGFLDDLTEANPLDVALGAFELVTRLAADLEVGPGSPVPKPSATWRQRLRPTPSRNPRGVVMPSPNVTDYAAFNDYAARYGRDLSSWARSVSSTAPSWPARLNAPA